VGVGGVYRDQISGDVQLMDYMFATGFLGTKAPFFMDDSTLVVSLLPLLVLIAVWLIRKGYYELHRIYQIVIFTVSFVVVGWFEYGARVGGGFSSFIEHNSLPSYLIYTVLIFHIIVSTVAFIWWARTIYTGNRYYIHRDLPGVHSLKHIRDGKWAIFGICMTSLTGIWLYLMLFLF